MRLALALAALFTSAAAGSGCALYFDDRPYVGGSGDVGDLTIRYTFDRTDCIQAGVDRIRVEVNGEVYGDRFSDVVDCTDYFFGVTLENLLEDRYRVAVEGLSRGGDVLFSTESDQTVEVRGGENREYTVPTVARQGDLRIFWTFDRSARCGAVTDIRVTLIDPEGSRLVPELHPCAFSGVEYPSVRVGLWTISLDGLDAAGRILYQLRDARVRVRRGSDNSFTLDFGARP